jgi:hypothetical protein
VTTVPLTVGGRPDSGIRYDPEATQRRGIISQALDRCGICNIEIADMSASQRLEMCRTAGKAANVTRKCAYIRPATASYRRFKPITPDAPNRPIVDLDADRRKVQRFAIACSRVGSAPIDPFRGIHRRNLLDTPCELCDRPEHRRVVRLRCRARLRAGRVISVRLKAEPDNGLINFRFGLDEVRQTRRTSNEYDQKTGRERVKSSQMADAPLAVHAAHDINNIV